MRSTGALVLVGAAVVWPSLGLAADLGAANSGSTGGARTAVMQADPNQPASGAAAPATPAPAAAAPVVVEPVPAPASAGDALGAPPDLEQGRTVPVEQTAATQDTYSSYEPPAHSNKGRVSGFMGWAFSVPIGSVRDFTAVVSPLGFEIMIDSWITDNLSVGASGEWATYVDDRPRTTNTVDNVSITATAYNYMQTASARALLHYYYLESESVYPYVGPHIGVNWTTFDSETADLVLTDNRVSFSFGAEAGVKIPFGRNAPMAIANLRYAANLQAEFTNKVTNVQALSLMLGLGF